MKWIVTQQALEEENTRLKCELVEAASNQQKEERLKTLQQKFSAKINELYVMNDSLAELLQTTKWPTQNNCLD